MSGQRIFPYRPVTTAWDIHDDTVEALSHGSKRQFGRVVVRDKQPLRLLYPAKLPSCLSHTIRNAVQY